VKREGNLWRQIATFENIHLAYLKARKGKQSRVDVAQFSNQLEPELFKLLDELTNGDYAPQPYRQFKIYDAKPRTISVAPFRDRVVQHAVMNYVEPRFDQRFIHHSYACRKNKGSHRAVQLYQQWARRFPYAVIIDIQKYFDSVDHELLKCEIRHYLKDPLLLQWFDRIVDSALPPTSPTQLYEGDDLVDACLRRTGMAIGNLSSQILANVYLNRFDHWVLHDLKPGGYLRYVDDMVLVGQDKKELAEMVDAIEQRLSSLRLRIHPNKRQVQPVRVGLPLLGFQVFPDRIRLNRRNGHLFQRKMRVMQKRYHQYKMPISEVGQCVKSWVGHASHADSHALREKMLGHVIFNRSG
jgi:RNA-directed DNA polymerase